MTILTRLASLILISSSLVSTVHGAAQNTLTDLDKSIDLSVGSHVKVERLLTDLQASVAKHNTAAVAALVHYPIKVNPGKHPITIKTKLSS
jgi:copper homeostasis protein CutC